MDLDILHYRKVNGGTNWKAEFTLVFKELGLKVHNCRLMFTNDQDWIAFPTRKIEKEGEEPKFYPYISFLELETKVEVQAMALALLTQMGAFNGDNTSKAGTNKIQGNTPSLW